MIEGEQPQCLLGTEPCVLKLVFRHPLRHVGIECLLVIGRVERFDHCPFQEGNITNERLVRHPGGAAHKSGKLRSETREGVGSRRSPRHVCLDELPECEVADQLPHHGVVGRQALLEAPEVLVRVDAKPLLGREGNATA